MSHRGPIQQFTEVCLACGRNIYVTDQCVEEKNCWTGLFSPTEDLPAATYTPNLRETAAKRAIGPQWGYEIVGDEMVDEDDLDAEAEIMAALTAPDDEPLIGDYVTQPPYLEMRLRMLLTGTASPSDEAWAAALSKLLTFLEQEYDR